MLWIPEIIYLTQNPFFALFKSIKNIDNTEFEKSSDINLDFSNIEYSKFKEKAPLIGAVTGVFDHKFFRNAK